MIFENNSIVRCLRTLLLAIWVLRVQHVVRAQLPSLYMMHNPVPLILTPLVGGLGLTPPHPRPPDIRYCHSIIMYHIMGVFIISKLVCSITWTFVSGGPPVFAAKSFEYGCSEWLPETYVFCTSYLGCYGQACLAIIICLP